MKIGTTEHISLNEMSDFVRLSPEGTRIVYATGELGRDRDMNPEAEIEMVGQLAFEAARSGKIFLAQKPLGGPNKFGCRRFEYTAMKMAVPTGQSKIPSPPPRLVGMRAA